MLSANLLNNMSKTTDSKIIECIFNIDMICRGMYQSYEDCQFLEIRKDTVLYSDLLRYRYLQICMILDEFELLTRLAKDNEYLKDTLYIVSPITKVLNKYTGIRKARNSIFAHFNRDKKRNFKPWWIALKDSNLPRSPQEIDLLYIWLHLLNAFLVTRYYKDLEAMSILVEPDLHSFTNWARNKENEITINTPFDSLAVEIQNRLNEKGIPDQLILDPTMDRVLNNLEKTRKAVDNSRFV